MKKIIATPQTVGVIIDRLRKITGGTYSSQHFRNEKSIKNMRGEHTSCLCTSAAAVVKPHWDFLNPSNTDWSKDHPQCLIHVLMDEARMFLISEGDVVYLQGSTLVIDEKDSTVLSSVFGYHRNFHVLKKIKKRSLLSHDELIEIQKSKDEIKKNVEDYLAQEEVFLDVDFDLLDATSDLNWGSDMDAEREGVW